MNIALAILLYILFCFVVLTFLAGASTRDR